MKDKITVPIVLVTDKKMSAWYYLGSGKKTKEVFSYSEFESAGINKAINNIYRWQL